MVHGERIRVEESRAERAAHAIGLAVSDFMLAIQDAQTALVAEDIGVMIGPLISVLESTEKKAFKKAGELTK